MSLIAPLYRPTSGPVLFEGRETSARAGRGDALRYRPQVQMIFQDPFGSLHPVKTIEHQIARPLRIHRIVCRSGSGSST